MEETVLVADTGTVTVRENDDGQVELGIGPTSGLTAGSAVKMVLTDRQVQSLAAELRYLADTTAERKRAVESRRFEQWIETEEHAVR